MQTQIKNRRSRFVFEPHTKRLGAVVCSVSKSDALAAVAPAGDGQVVGECLDPDVHGLALITWNWNAPLDLLAGDGEVSETGADETANLVEPG